MDYKYDMQLRAEELVEERYGVDYSQLEESKQHKLFEEAHDEWIAEREARTDAYEDR